VRSVTILGLTLSKEKTKTIISNTKENTNSSENKETDTNHKPQNTDQRSVISDNPSQVSHVSQTDDRNGSVGGAGKNNDPDAYWTKGKWRDNLPKEHE
jgi:hypothetical protein